MRSYRRWLVLALMVCPAWAVAATMLKPLISHCGPAGLGYAGHDDGRMAATPASAGTDAIPPKQEVLAILRKVNSYQFAHPVISKWEVDHPGASPMHWPWPRATYYTGVMAVWKATHDRSFLEQAARWGRESQWGVGEEQLGANRLFPMQTWLEVYFVKKDHAMIEPSIKWLATPDPLTPAGARRWYLDGRGTGPPFLTRTPSMAPPPSLCSPKATGDKKYLDIMNAFFDDVTNELYDQETGLYYRDPPSLGSEPPMGKRFSGRAGMVGCSLASPEYWIICLRMIPAGRTTRKFSAGSGGIDQAAGRGRPMASEPR